MCGIFGQIKKIVYRNQRIDKQITFQNACLCQHRGPDNTSNVFFTYKDFCGGLSDVTRIGDSALLTDFLACSRFA